MHEAKRTAADSRLETGASMLFVERQQNSNDTHSHGLPH